MLAEFTDADVDRLVEWIDSPELLGQWAGPAFAFPFTREQMELHLSDRGDRHIFKVLSPETGEHIGHVELGAINHAHRSARIGRVFIAPEQRGRGYGTRLMQEVLEIAFGRLHLHRVDLSVFTFNSSAIACYEKVGFQREGLRREVYRGPAGFWSEIVMSILAPEWRLRAGSTPFAGDVGPS
jgi:RimJ/RimL family protein N-acetyltransferase